LNLRHTLAAVVAVLPVLLFSLMPIAAMSPAFEEPAIAQSWSSQA
jgi:hypothetical protein